MIVPIELYRSRFPLSTDSKIVKNRFTENSWCELKIGVTWYLRAYKRLAYGDDTMRNGCMEDRTITNGNLEILVSLTRIGEADFAGFCYSSIFTFSICSTYWRTFTVSQKVAFYTVKIASFQTGVEGVLIEWIE